jgi:hypothetical protein
MGRDREEVRMKSIEELLDLKGKRAIVTGGAMGIDSASLVVWLKRGRRSWSRTWTVRRRSKRQGSCVTRG